MIAEELVKCLKEEEQSISMADWRGIEPHSGA
jgi:hypothetical protein